MKTNTTHGRAKTITGSRVITGYEVALKTRSGGWRARKFNGANMKEAAMAYFSKSTRPGHVTELVSTVIFR